MKNLLNWRNVLWREWRNCEDMDYAKRLLLLLWSDQLTGPYSLSEEIKKLEYKLCDYGCRGIISGGILLVIIRIIFRVDILYFVYMLAVPFTEGRGRFFCFWWRRRPLRSEVIASLEEAARYRRTIYTGGDPDPLADMIDKFLRMLQSKASDAVSPGPLILSLSSRSWIERMAAAFALVGMGGQAAASLRDNYGLPAQKERGGLGKRLIRWCLRGIERETSEQLAGQMSSYFCPHCLTRYRPNRIRLSVATSVTCHGCRSCYDSREYVECGEATVVLDTRPGTQMRMENGCAEANWFEHKALFDFDRVEIRHASDAEVERFAVQVGNDTDPFQQRRYKKMVCQIAPECRLSENTVRMLKSLFGRIETGTENRADKHSVRDTKKRVLRNKTKG